MHNASALRIDTNLNSSSRTKWLENIPEHHQKLLEFWEVLKPRDGLPKRRDFDVPDLLPWLGNLHLVEIYDDDARYLVYGSNIARIHRREWTGKKFSELNDPKKDRLLAYYMDVRDACRPLAHTVSASIETKYFTWSRLFAPFADDQGDVRYILVHNVLLNDQGIPDQFRF